MTPHEGSPPTVEDAAHRNSAAVVRARRYAPAAVSSPTAAPARGFLLVVLAALCWGTSGITGDLVADRTDLDPLDVAWHRMAIGAAVLLAVHLLSRRRPGTAVPRTRPLRRRLAAVGIGLAVYQSAYFAAVATAGVGIATLVALGR